MKELTVPEEIPHKSDPEDIEGFTRELIAAARDVRTKNGDRAVVCAYFLKHEHAQAVANLLYSHYQGVYADRIEVGLYH